MPFDVCQQMCLKALVWLTKCNRVGAKHVTMPGGNATGMACMVEQVMFECRTGRQPDPNRTSYHAYLYAFLIDVSLNASPLAFLNATCAPVRSVSHPNVQVALHKECWCKERSL